MKLWRQNANRDLERRLREERPEARGEFVRQLSGEPTATGGPQRGGNLPRLAALGAATALVAASLGVAGAFGSASGSLHTFGSNFVHIVWSNNDGNTGDDGNDGNDGSYCKKAFCYQYHHKVPICYKGGLEFVSWFDWFKDIKLPDYTFAHYSHKSGKFYCGSKPNGW